jgi:hypothetical protein
MYTKVALSLLVLTGGVLAEADQSSYAAAGNSYAAPAQQNSYAAPAAGNSYAAPAAQNNYAAPAAQNNYAAPAPSQSGYGAPTGGNSYQAPAVSYPSASGSGYDAPDYYDGSYGAPQATGTGEEGGVGFSLEEIIPLFLVVLAAVILAGLLGPLFSQFLMLFVALAPAALNVKAPIVNAILAPFNLVLCMTDATTGPTVVTGRSFDEWEMDTTYIQLFFNAYDMIMANSA